ncbi:hypothetical protein BDN70DRAFT_873831 [Pholiota conissans]|uniref:Nucleoprotein TPR/MLP1 domain-containing protein n=1 Tax=Pholiota conissans TaxID=109636 RepID=A0A9P6CXZ5_9AGAR|nr:hypothetical protein BDN70DRAFT_873831 [Pholiota conissans]
MMKTRRKSKAAAEEAGSDDVHHPFSVAIPDDIEEDVLVNILPDLNFSSLTSDDVLEIYRMLITQAASIDNTERERDEVRAELERKDVELDQALQDKETLAKDLEDSSESVHNELTQVKQERDQLAESKVALQHQLTALSNSQSSSTTEVETLRRRVDDTEREKRELITVISRLKDEGTQRDEEIHTLRSNLKEARHEHQALEAQVRELRSTETATKFKIESLSQQLQLSQAEAERANSELSTKTEEFAKYRRMKHAEVATLQASFDSLTQSHASMEASFKALQSSNTAQSHQLTQALSKVQELTGQLAEQEARYSNETSGLKRLVSMMEDREKQAKEIVENIEREWATVGEKAERRENVLKAETEKERKAREEAEKRLDQLEAVLEKMGRGELPIPGRSAPSTPFRTSGLSDHMVDGMMGLSPTVAMASRSQRSGKTFTEVYADYVRLQEDYAKKSAEYDHMDRTLSSVLAQIEERAPILSQQRLEYERLQVEASQLGSQLAQALADRDAQATFAQEQGQKSVKSTNENNLLQKQLDDLGRQVRTLLRELTRRDDPTIPPDEELEALAENDTQAMISNNLVLFRSIDELQIQNQRILKIVRDLGERMEGEEKAYREIMEKEQAEAIREAHEAMQELASQLETQKKSSDSLIQSYVKERDTLRGLLARSQKGAETFKTVTVNGTRTTDGDSELAKELAEVQGQFEAYKTETDVDSSRLRNDLVAAQREVNQLAASLAKANAKIEYLSDRHRMHEEQFRVHNQEIDELSKRNSQLHEQTVRLDIECGRVTDDLQVALGRTEQLRNECANLRAEKKIWESVQGRLVEENRSLAMERSHLADLMSNVQKMHNDLERSGENDRRRLESQLQMLENQTQDLRAQLVQERDAVRHLSLQKDLELKDLQTRLEKGVQEFSKTRELLVEAQTSKKHLEDKVEDLTRQLKGNEEKLAVYERRPGATSTIQTMDQDVSREQQLETEVAELRSALKVTQVDLAAARSHRDQYQEISHANEAALATLNSTFDEYKASTEAQLAHHESQSKAMQERLHHTNAELIALRAQFNESQKAFETERTTWINDKKTLEDTIVDMSTSEKHSESDRSTFEQELTNLEDRAKSAEERYSHEIIAHAESMKAIDALKKDLTATQAAVREHLTAAETARAKLASSENSWAQQKDALIKEAADLNARCNDLSHQNSILHQHLESLSAQATRIRQAADAPVENNVDGEVADDTDNRVSELRSVVNYLRKEKGIVDLQLEMSKRENEVLKGQIDRLSQTLQETRDTLAEERERAIQNTTSAAQHAELVERINQLNILRESNATLRAECESASKKARDLDLKLKELSSELDPAKEEAQSAKAELEATKVQMQRLEQESKRWQERNTQLLSKYDRIDPSEVQALRDEIAKFKTESSASDKKLEEKEEEVNLLKARVEALEGNIRSHKEAVAKTNTSFRAKLGEVNSQKSALNEEKRQLEARVAALQQEIAALQAGQTSNATNVAASDVTSMELQKQIAMVATLQNERDALLAEKDTWTKAAATTGDSAPAPNGWETEKAQLLRTRDEALEKLKAVTAESQKVTNEYRTIKFQNDKFQARIQDLTKARQQEAEKQAAAIAEAVEKAKTETNNVGPVAPALEQLSRRHAEELKSLEEKLNGQHSAELKTRIDAAVEAALKARPASAPPVSSTDQQAAIDAAIAEHKKEIEVRHAEEIASAVDRGRMEQAAKGKLKDSQLVKAQKRVKELEAQIHDWQVAGLIPAATPAAGATVPATSTAVPSVPAASAPTKPGAPHPAAVPVVGSQVKPNPAAAATAAAANAPGNLPRRPPGANAPSTSGGVGLGRGGALAVRGRGRGNAPLRTAPMRPPQSANATPSPTTGVSIIGAAAKRPHEDGSTMSDGSLAKRLKPTEPS